MVWHTVSWFHVLSTLVITTTSWKAPELFIERCNTNMHRVDVIHKSALLVNIWGVLSQNEMSTLCLLGCHTITFRNTVPYPPVMFAYEIADGQKSGRVGCRACAGDSVYVILFVCFFVVLSLMGRFCKSWSQPWVVVSKCGIWWRWTCQWCWVGPGHFECSRGDVEQGDLALCLLATCWKVVFSWDDLPFYNGSEWRGP